MGNIPIFENPDFNSQMEALKTNTPAHADIFNAMFQILLNNDVFLNNNKAASDHTHLIDLSEIDEAFKKVFSYLESEEPTVTAMTPEEIEEAINTPWDGTSSDDPNALSATDIEKALATPWDGESSTDPNAMTSEEINEAIANAT